MSGEKCTESAHTERMQTHSDSQPVNMFKGSNKPCTQFYRVYVSVRRNDNETSPKKWGENFKQGTILANNNLLYISTIAHELPA